MNSKDTRERERERECVCVCVCVCACVREYTCELRGGGEGNKERLLAVFLAFVCVELYPIRKHSGAIHLYAILPCPCVTYSSSASILYQNHSNNSHQRSDSICKFVP